jgi:nucleoside-diphosphate kinase
MEQTLLIIKPDATERHLYGRTIQRLEDSRFEILAMKMVRLNREGAEQFYAVHKDKPFYDALVEFMTSGPIVPILLERENAILALRDLVGATDPAKAVCGTIRHDIGLDVQRNSVHASDAPETARKEIAFFFGDD